MTSGTQTTGYEVPHHDRVGSCDVDKDVHGRRSSLLFWFNRFGLLCELAGMSGGGEVLTYGFGGLGSGCCTIVS